MYYRQEEYEFYNHRDMQLLLFQRSYLINPAFKMCGEEFYLYHNGNFKQWDLVAIDESFIYLIELKVNKVETKDLIRMEIIADKIKSYKPVKILLVTPGITDIQKRNISKYKKIQHIEINEVKHNPNMLKPAKREEIKVKNHELRMLQLLQGFEYNYFNYYRGYEIIENYYINLKFKFNNSLGIILRYNLQNDYFEYELIEYITQMYTQTQKIFHEIYYLKFNIIFDTVLSSVNIKKSENHVTKIEIDELMEELGKIDNIKKCDISRTISNMNRSH
ncbi:MAG: hypothetical protein ACI8WT_004088 [Clostridium sp.]|jgi:hypothetical protein